MKIIKAELSYKSDLAVIFIHNKVFNSIGRRINCQNMV